MSTNWLIRVVFPTLEIMWVKWISTNGLISTNTVQKKEGKKMQCYKKVITEIKSTRFKLHAFDLVTFHCHQTLDACRQHCASAGPIGKQSRNITADLSHWTEKCKQQQPIFETLKPKLSFHKWIAPNALRMCNSSTSKFT